MTEILNVDNDPRTPLDRLRRVELLKLAKGWGVTVPHTAPATTMRELLRSYGVDPMRKPPNGEGIDWVVVQRKQENGGIKTDYYPARQPAATAGKSIDYQGEIDKRSKNDEIADLKAQIAQLQALMNRPIPMAGLREKAKKMGLPITRGMKRAEMEALIHGQDTAAGG